MGFAHADMLRKGVKQPNFYKLVGSGSGVGFDPKPNWSRYGMLATWDDEASARQAMASHPTIQRWRRHADDSETFILENARSNGLWSGHQPFPASVDENQRKSAGQDGPVGVITRARLRWSILYDFWRRVPGISEQIDGADGLLFKAGIGEVPWLHQITFSLWKDEKSIRDFAYKSGAHATAISAARSGGWFGEDLFARFRLIEHTTE